MAAIAGAGLEPGAQMTIALDIAATELFSDGQYELRSELRALRSATWSVKSRNGATNSPSCRSRTCWPRTTGTDGQRRLSGLARRSTSSVTTSSSPTGPDWIEGIAESVANSVLVKVNQNGLVSGARTVLERAQQAGYGTIVSARSGETEDAWLADLAVGWNAAQIKVGSTHRSERTAKWNRLLELETLEDTTFCGPWTDRLDDGVLRRSRP